METGDGLAGLRTLASDSVDLVFTSPPYANRRAYARIPPDQYVSWFLPWASEIQRILRPSGSFVLNINDCVIAGERHLYVFDLVSAIRRIVGLRYIERYLWVKTATVPGRQPRRFKDQIEYLFHFAKAMDFKIRHEAVKVPVKPDTVRRILRAQRHTNGREFSPTGSGFSRNLGNMPLDYALPGNVLFVHPETRVPGHSAPGPVALPDFFIRAFTDAGDLVVDPFAGSGTTGVAAVRLDRDFLGWELREDYAELARRRICVALSEAGSRKGVDPNEQQ